ncbi:molecular chaperone [Serratia marcescens]|uniref:Molecular chaperone n=2 Tax=Serratia TaxID=613 RepID=A0A5C7BNI2_SERMA|nr:molecular chaperone [Serratia marcescens]TXE53374.1 molecular chaperone [Serratia marcescens]
MKKILIVSVFVGTGVLARPVLADGVGINALRIIYPAKSHGVATTVRNTTKDDDYLTQVTVSSGMDGGDAPFITTPPIFRLAAKSENRVRIIKTGGNLPSDRESLFWFTMKAIPVSSDGNTVDGKVNGAVQIGLGNMIKLFYRPDGLPVPPEKGFCMLTFKQTSAGIDITNNSPYFVSFASFNVGGKERMSQTQPVKMVAPLSHEEMKVKGVHAPASIDWAAITDYGGTVNCKGSLL